MTRGLLSWAGGLLFVAAVLGSLYMLGRMHEREAWQAREVERMAAISLAVGETVARANALAVDVERLRKRPERIKEVVKEIRVEADAECSSISPDYRRLWNAGDRAPTGPAAVGDDGMPRMAATGR